jgi:pimeloyl-ACP methyl ester carboxylesterase
MRTSPLFVAAFAMVAALAGAARPIQAQACEQASQACWEYVPLGLDARVGVYRSHPLTGRNEALTRALIVVHGAERHAVTSYNIATDVTRNAGEQVNTLVIAPRFAANVGKACSDELGENELNWNCDVVLTDWRAGGLSINFPKIASFDVVDALLETLNRRELFPNLKTIVVAGHSAGGQFVTNYQMSNRAHNHVSIKPLYVTANASAYAYPDSARPIPAKLEGCITFADWPFGFAKLTGYAARLTVSELTRQAVERPATYLVGQMDVGILNQGGFYAGCEGQAQGMNIQARGLEFAKHMTERFNATHQAVVVKNCGHSESCMFSSLEAYPLLFPKIVK